VTKVALKLKYQIEQVICIELDESAITNANSSVITKGVVDTARNAGGEEFKSCVVYCLLVCVRWFKIQAKLEVRERETPCKSNPWTDRGYSFGTRSCIQSVLRHVR
jgi:hypothetical protein